MDRARLLRFYQKYNPEKLHEVDGVLERYKGREQQMFAALVKKYGPEPSDDDDVDHGTRPKGKQGKKGKTKAKEQEEAEEEEQDQAKKQRVKVKSIDEITHDRLVAFYEKYNPDKLHEVDAVLAKYKGKEAQLFNALVKKYGPEPDDSDDDNDDDDDDKDNDQEEDEEGEDTKDEDGDDKEEAEEEDDDDDEPKLKQVLYCPIDTLPPEYSEYGPMFNECKPWLAEHCPDLFLQKYNRTVSEFMEAERLIAEGVEGITLEADGSKSVKKKKNQKNAGPKDSSKALVHIVKSSRKSRKYLTTVTGLEAFELGMNIKEATKKLGKRFACSASISKTDAGQQQIQLQGDCQAELVEVLEEMFGIPEQQLVLTEESGKKKKK